MSGSTVLTRRYLAVLNDELGWEAVEHGDEGDVVFEYLGLNIWITSTLSDPSYLRMHTGIHLPGYLEPLGALNAGDPTSHSFLLRLASELTHTMKGTKVVLAGEFVVFAVEMPVAADGCLPKAEILAAVLPRVRRMLGSAIGEFHERVILAGIEAATAAAPGIDGGSRR